ncbi:MAG TPA: rhodanese-like domain-containing protein [Thermoanaerobaculia bacterium]|nr:rhodanese-like domain-containing protein [Thermoanaerobaculia bacterium]
MHKITLLAALLLTIVGCKTLGVGQKGGYAAIRATIANELMLDNSQVLVMDVRPLEEFNGPRGHIAGSLSSPIDSIEMKLPELAPYQNSTVLVYGNDSEDGARAARILVAAGFRNVVNIAGGLNAWIEHGYRVVNSQ